MYDDILWWEEEKGVNCRGLREPSEPPPTTNRPPARQLLHTHGTVSSHALQHKIARTMRSAAVLALVLPLTTAFSSQPTAQTRVTTSLAAHNQLDRRSALLQGSTYAGLALSSLLLSPEVALAIQDYDDAAKKRILITGSNSGIGLDAAQRMALRGHEVVLACVSSVRNDARFFCAICILTS